MMRIFLQSRCRCLTSSNFLAISWRRRLTTKGKPDWMIAAENEARAAQGNRSSAGMYQSGPTSMENTFMNLLKHDIGSESVSNTARLQGKLEGIIKELATMPSATSIEKDKYDQLRKQAIDLRNQVIIQREAAGFTRDNASVVESAFPIPNRG